MSEKKGKSSKRGTGDNSTKVSQQQQPDTGHEERIKNLLESLKNQEEQIAIYKINHDNIRKENIALREELKSFTREKLQVISALETATTVATAQASALQLELDACKEKHEDTIKQLRDSEVELRGAHALECRQLQARIAELEALVQEARDLFVRRDEVNEQLRECHARNKEMEESYEFQLGEMHIRAHRLEQRIADLEGEAARQAEAAGAKDESEASPIKLLNHNRKLAVILRKSNDEILSLKTKIKDMERSMAELKTALTVATTLESQAIQQTSAQSLRQEKASEKIHALHQELEMIKCERDEAIATHKGLESRIQAAEQEVAARDRRAQRQALDARHAQNAIKELLDERSEVQAFLISSIRGIQKQIQLEETSRQEHGKLHPARERTFSVGKNDRKDVSDFSWEEREAILRLVLAHINGKIYDKRDDGHIV